jgi:hypothetical protein
VLLQAFDVDVPMLTDAFARALTQARDMFAEKFPGYHLGTPDLDEEDYRLLVEIHSNDTDETVRPADLPKAA